MKIHFDGLRIAENLGCYSRSIYLRTVSINVGMQMTISYTPFYCKFDFHLILR